MSNATLFQDLAAEVDTGHRAQFRSHYREVRELPQSDLDLQAFLDQYLQRLVQLYAATAGAIWFRSQSGETLASKARIAWDRLGLVGELAASHQQLLHYGMTRPRSFLVRPFSAPARGARVSNPTDSFLVLGPVAHQGEQIAIVELSLGPRPIRGRTAAERNRYVLWLDHLLAFLCQGIEARLLRNSAPLPAAMQQLAVAVQDVAAIQLSLQSILELHLGKFAGWNFGSLADNQSFTTRVHELLEQFGLRVVCPQCGTPAILRCQKAGNTRTGVFLYDHTVADSRTFHGGPSTFPKVALVQRPGRRK